MFHKSKWKDWEDPEEAIDPDIEEVPGYLRTTRRTIQDALAEQYSIRNLADATGISKSEVSLALQRSYLAGLAKPDRLTGIPRVNQRALSEFIIHELRYVYPEKLLQYGPMPTVRRWDRLSHHCLNLFQSQYRGAMASARVTSIAIDIQVLND